MYNYLCTCIYRYIYIHVCVCVCAPLENVNDRFWRSKNNHIIPISHDIPAYSPFNTYGHQEPHLHPVGTNTLP